MFNVDTRDLASECAAALGASKLVFMTDKAWLQDTVTGQSVGDEIHTDSWMVSGSAQRSFMSPSCLLYTHPFGALRDTFPAVFLTDDSRNFSHPYIVTTHFPSFKDPQKIVL